MCIGVGNHAGCSDGPNTKRTNSLGREFLDAAKDPATVREADADGGPTARLLEALQAIREGEGETIAPADLLEALRARPGWDWLKSTRRLAGLLNPLGFVRQQLRVGDRVAGATSSRLASSPIFEPGTAGPSTPVRSRATPVHP